MSFNSSCQLLPDSEKVFRSTFIQSNWPPIEAMVLEEKTPIEAMVSEEKKKRVIKRIFILFKDEQ